MRASRGPMAAHVRSAVRASTRQGRGMPFAQIVEPANIHQRQVPLNAQTVQQAPTRLRKEKRKLQRALNAGQESTLQHKATTLNPIA